MGQASPFLRRVTNGFSHWCPGCKEMHVIETDAPNSCGARWSFDGDVSRPTFSPSIHIRINHPEMSGYQADIPSETCHYFLKAGSLEFLSDCTHELKGKTVPLPELPPRYRDSPAE